MYTKYAISYGSIQAIRRTKTRVLYFALCTLGMGIVANAGPRIITFDAPGAGATPGSGQGTACYNDCSVTINIWGAITGSYLDANNVFHGFVRSPEGKFATFDVPGADTTPQTFRGTLPQGINDAGVITGLYSDASGTPHGFLRSPEGGYITFDAFVGGGSATFPIALNLEGAVVGYASDANGAFHGFLRRPNGTFATWIGPGGCDASPGAGCFGTAAFSINMFGSIAGAFEDNGGNFVGHGLIRNRNGRLATYNVRGAGSGLYQGTGCPGCSVPQNQFGEIASFYIDSNNVVHNYVRRPWGEITTFDVPGAGTGCSADCSLGLNDWGEITGSYLDANNVYHGYVRSPEGKFSTFDAPGADLKAGDFNGTYPISINDAGAVAGYYEDANYVVHGFVRFP